MSQDILYPIEQAASAIAYDKWPDTHTVLAVESWHLKFPGKPTPVLNGEESDRAFLAAMRHESMKSLQQAIDSLVRQKLLTPLDPTGMPISEIQGAWLSKSELLQLVAEKKHLSVTSEQPAPESVAVKPVAGGDKGPGEVSNKKWQLNKPKRMDSLGSPPIFSSKQQ